MICSGKVGSGSCTTTTAVKPSELSLLAAADSHHKREFIPNEIMYSHVVESTQRIHMIGEFKTIIFNCCSFHVHKFKTTSPQLHTVKKKSVTSIMSQLLCCVIDDICLFSSTVEPSSSRLSYVQRNPAYYRRIGLPNLKSKKEMGPSLF